MLSDHLKAVFFVSFLVLLYTLYNRLGNVSYRRVDPELSSETLSTTLATNKDSSSKTYLLGEGRNEFLQTDSSEPLQSIQPSFSSSQDHLVDQKTRPLNISRSHSATIAVTSNDKETIKAILSTSESVNYASQHQSVSVETLAAPNMYDPPPKSTGEGIPGSPIMATKSTVVTAYGATESNTLNLTCYADVLQNMKPVCHPMCLSGAFSLPGMSECHPLLTCQDILSDITRVKQIGEGVVKRVFVGNWKNFTVAVSELKDRQFIDDFQYGIKMLKALTGSKFVVQLVGVCSEENIFVTEYHPLGNVNTFVRRLKEHPQLQPYNSIANRMRFCLDYISIISFLHNSPIGTRVMCDSSQLGKLLHQLLVTNGLRLILNDVDALPEVKNSLDGKIVCGHSQLVGEFVAPEQKWPFPNLLFSPQEQPPYDEKTDIWKVPNVCEYFLGDDSSADLIKYKLFETHKRCKSVIPTDRPCSEEVLNVYELVYNGALQETPKT